MLESMLFLLYIIHIHDLRTVLDNTIPVMFEDLNETDIQLTIEFF